MKRIPVFISSKQSELHQDRVAVVDAVRRGEMLEPVFAEEWAPRRAPPAEVYRTDASRCPLYVGLFWRKYSAATEEEYRITVSNRETEILLYVRDCSAEEREEPLRQLIAEFHKQHTCRSYGSTAELRKLVPEHLQTAVARMVTRLHLLGMQTRSGAEPGRLTSEGLIRAWGLEGETGEIIAALERARDSLRAGLGS